MYNWGYKIGFEFRRLESREPRGAREPSFKFPGLCQRHTQKRAGLLGASRGAGFKKNAAQEPPRPEGATGVSPNKLNA